MKIGCQTILWGSRIKDPVEVFHTIHELGFQGVEICQPPSVLPKPEELREIFEYLGLEFVGFYGGSLQDRMSYCRDFKPQYLCINDWDEKSCRMAIQNEYILAMHPHMYYRNSTEAECRKIFTEHPELKFLPDTAHLFLGRDDPAEAIRRHKDRVVAVHLKDWTPKYGRSFHRYARGFVELGRGIIDLKKVLKLLEETGYEGWVIVEQDYTAFEPKVSAQISIDWLQDNDVKVPTVEVKQKELVPKPKSRRHRIRKKLGKATFLMDTLMRTKNRGIPFFRTTVLETLNELVPCKVATLWEFSRTRDLLGLLAFWPPGAKPDEPFSMKCAEVLSGVTVESQVVSHLNPRQNYGKHRFAHPEFFEKYGADRMISIPVLNTYNPNHTELIINLYPKNKRSEKRLSDKELATCADYIAIAYEGLLEDICQSAASAVNMAVVHNRTSKKFLKELCQDIKRAVNCEAVTIFLVHESESLVPISSTGKVEWKEGTPPGEQYYKRGEGLTGKVWQRRMPLLTVDAPHNEDFLGKSREETDTEPRVCLITPVMDPRVMSSEGKVLGVIRCVNKHATQISNEINIFSESDLSIVDAIGQAMVPHLSVLLAEEDRARKLGQMTHELKGPLTSVRGAVEFIIRDASKPAKLDSVSARAGEIVQWSDLATRLIENVEFFRYGVEGLTPKAEKLSLYNDVFVPLLSPIAVLLRELDFTEKEIKAHTLKDLPDLWLDMSLFQQAFFNLISNVITHARMSANDFRVEIEGRKADKGFEILLKDWGCGIPKGYEEMIFQEGIRGPHAEQSDVSGGGLGLWVVSEIIGSHGGHIRVSNLAKPTTFAIWLPKKIENKW